jgi:hypothetical protein
VGVPLRCLRHLLMRLVDSHGGRPVLLHGLRHFLDAARPHCDQPAPIPTLHTLGRSNRSSSRLTLPTLQALLWSRLLLGDKRKRLERLLGRFGST